MKYIKTLVVLLFSSVIFFYACKDSTNSQKQEPLQPLEAVDTPPPASATTSTPATSEPAQNTGQVFHYTCSKGCAGGAASAGNCETCGSPLAHNQAFHSNASTEPIAAPFYTPTTPTTTSNASNNSTGVFHYICGNGCEGGAGSAGNCSTCGGELSHNTAYHQ